jgi:hypothetical protein
MVDTERGSGELYAPHFVYEVDQLAPPFTPERYMEKVDEAESEGFDNLIIDSLSHAWIGQGGIVEIADRLGKGSKSPFGGWRDASPMHNRLVDYLLDYPGNLIVTMRTKTAYDIQENDRGKKAPIKIGMAPVQKDGLEYEFTVVFDLAVIDHTATANKDRTQLFKEALPFVINKETGALIRSWLESGETPQETYTWLMKEATDAMDRRSWYRENQPLIRTLPGDLQVKLIEHLRSLQAAKAA